MNVTNGNTPVSEVSWQVYNEKREERLRPDEMSAGAEYFARIAISNGQKDYAGDFRVEIAAIGEVRRRFVVPGLLKPSVKMTYLPINPDTGQTIEEQPDTRVVTAEGVIFDFVLPFAPIRMESGYFLSTIDEDDLAVSQLLSQNSPQPLPVS